MSKLIYENLAALKPVELVIKDATEAIKDNNRILIHSDIKEILGAVGGIGAGAGVGVGGMVLGAASGTSGAAALTSGLATAGGIVGGGMMAGIVVVAAPAVILGLFGYGLVSRRNKKQLIQEKEMLFQEALKKRDAILKMLKEKHNVSKDRLDYLTTIITHLTGIINNLEKDKNA